MSEYMVAEPWMGWSESSMTRHDQSSVNRFLFSLDEHAGAFFAYALVGASDPTNAADIPFWTRQGFTKAAATGLAFARGFFVTGAIGYIFDPLDLRPGWDADVPFFQAWKDTKNWEAPPDDWSGWN